MRRNSPELVTRVGQHTTDLEQFADGAAGFRPFLSNAAFPAAGSQRQNHDGPAENNRRMTSPPSNPRFLVGDMGVQALDVDAVGLDHRVQNLVHTRDGCRPSRASGNKGHDAKDNPERAQGHLEVQRAVQCHPSAHRSGYINQNINRDIPGILEVVENVPAHNLGCDQALYPQVHILLRDAWNVLPERIDGQPRGVECGGKERGSLSLISKLLGHQATRTGQPSAERVAREAHPEGRVEVISSSPERTRACCPTLRPICFAVSYWSGEWPGVWTEIMTPVR